MLPAAHRMRSAGDFRRTMRGGVRAGRPALVVVGRRRSERDDPVGTPDTPGVDDPARLGLVVSKAVGGAVVRNRVKRRLRHLAAPRLVDPAATGTDWVVRALPPAADATDLADQLADAWDRVARKLSMPDPHQSDPGSAAGRSSSVSISDHRTETAGWGTTA